MVRWYRWSGGLGCQCGPDGHVGQSYPDGQGGEDLENT